MGTNAQLERRAVTPRLFDWLETEFPFFPVLRTLEREHMIRCEEYVDGGRYVLRAELPGIDPEKDVTVSVADGVLRVHAERRETTRDQKRSEFTYGSMSRALTLPPGANEDSVAATYRDGILRVTVDLPETVTGKAKQIPIEIERDDTAKP